MALKPQRAEEAEPMHDREPPTFSRPPMPPQPAGGDYPAIVTQQPQRRRRQGPPPPRRKKRGSWLVFIFGTVFTLLVLAGIGIAVLLSLHPPGQLVRDQLISRTKEATGRTLTLAGETGLQFWPSLAVTLRDVTLSAPPGMRAPPTLKAESASAQLAIWPLLEGRVVVEGVTLKGPRIDLRKDRNGRTSWSMASLLAPDRDARPVRFAQAATGTTTDAAPVGFAAPGLSGGDALDRIELKRISVSDGIVVYTDEQSGVSETVRNVNADVTGRGLRDPLKLAGNLATRGETFRFTGEVKNPRALIDGQSSGVTFAVSSAVINLTARGSLKGGETPSFQGPFTTKIPQLGPLLRLADHVMPNGDLIGAVELDGDLSASPAAVAFDARKIALGDTIASGDVGAALAGNKPRLNANLKINKIDVAKLARGFEGFGPAKTRRAAPATRSAPARQPAPAKPKSIDDILRGTSSEVRPQVRGYRAINGWPADPVPMAALNAFNLAATLKIGPILYDAIRVDSSALRLVVSDGTGRLHIDGAKLYDGAIRGAVALSPARGRSAEVKANIRTTDAVSAQRLLKAFANNEMLSGTASLGFNLVGTGPHVAAIMQSLGGAAEAKINDGALNGWNIAELIRGLRQGRLDGLNRSPSQKTDFTEMTASFRIVKGVATNRDLRASSPLLRVTGEGDIDIGKRRLNYLVKPKLVATLDGQGGNDVSGLTVPVKVTGSWDEPKLEPQLADMITQQPVIRDAARKVREQFKNKKPEDIVSDILKNDGKDVKGVLKGLFGR
jgi:AsmA protein